MDLQAIPTTQLEGRFDVPGKAAFGPGDVLAERFRIVRFIAAGGMGEVYEAEDLELGERVAIKALRPEVSADQTALKRFRREVQLSRRVTHPSVCRCFDIFRHEEGVFLSMELLAGETLRQRILRDGPLEPDEALSIARQVAAALDAAHAVGIIHRDLKSSNVILVPTDSGTRAVVTDFGLARLGQGQPISTLTAADKILGTPAYMAPEQVHGDKLTAAIDIYAFGVVVYEMVTRRLPFEDENPMTMALRRLREEPPPPRLWNPDLDPQWERAILSCLSLRPEDRFSTASAAIRSLADDLGGRNPAPQERRRAVTVAAAFVLAVLGVLGGRELWKPSHPGQPAPSPRRRSVAVLGFTNLSGNGEAAWLSTALSEMLTMELAADDSLRAIPGEDVARMKLELKIPEAPSLAPETLARIGRNLDTDLLVLGSYVATGRRGRRRIRVDLRLENAADGSPLTVVTEEGSEAELLRLVGRIGERVRAALDLET